MKKAIALLSLIMVFTACKKDEKVENTVPARDSVQTITSDSAEISAPGNPGALKIDPLDAETGSAQTIFLQNGKTVFYFDNQLQSGVIRINGQNFTLNKISFSENTYEVSGDGILITANNGNFQYPVGDCTKGHFGNVTVAKDGQKTNLTNVDVQDCQNY